ncbi:MAG: TonB-dependent receptor [Opitutae bacterium]|nr:TonB-dependent receptor [Opitutae bacterium]
MKNTTSFILSLFLCSSLLGQGTDANASRQTLEEIAVQGTQLEGLDLSRSTVLGSGELESRKVNTLGDLSGLAPNLYLSENGIKSFGDVLTIRGIGNTQFFGSPGVQMYVDGVPQGNVFSYGSNLYDLEAVEVLKGPQLSRFGKLAPGGAINLITRKPGDEQVNRVSASYATFNTQKYDLASSGPMDGDLSYSLAVQRSSSDGFLSNSAGRNNDSESWNGGLRLHWDGGEGTRATLGLSFATHELGAQPIVLRDGGDFYDRSTNFDEYTEIDQNQQFLKIQHELDSGTLLSITNRNEWKMNPNRLDIDLSNEPNQYTGPPVMFINHLDSLHYMTSTIQQNQDTWSQEFHYTNTSSDDFSWSIGTYFGDDEVEGVATRFVGVPVGLNTYMGMGIPTTYLLKSQNLAASLNLEKAVSEIDLLSFDLRHDDFDKSMLRTNMGVQTHDSSKDFSGIAGSANWQRKLSDTTSLNLRIGYTEKPGGYSAFTSTPGDEVFSEEKITSYEASLDLSPSETWQVNFTAFFNDIEDYQFELNEPLTMNYYLENADEASVYGIEVDSTWLIEGGWAFSASYGLMESEFEKVSVPTLPALSNLNGKQLTFVPSHSLSLLLSHELDNGLSYQVGSRTIGKSYYWDNTGTNSDDNIGAYTLIDAGIGYEINDWDITVFGTNLTDEEYYTSLVSTLGFGNGNAPGVAGSPRVIGLSISREF